jgi:hypothetical protein
MAPMKAGTAQVPIITSIKDITKEKGDRLGPATQHYQQSQMNAVALQSHIFH